MKTPIGRQLQQDVADGRSKILPMRMVQRYENKRNAQMPPNDFLLGTLLPGASERQAANVPSRGDVRPFPRRQTFLHEETFVPSRRDENYFREHCHRKAGSFASPLAVHRHMWVSLR